MVRLDLRHRRAAQQRYKPVSKAIHVCNTCEGRERRRPKQVRVLLGGNSGLEASAAHYVHQRDGHLLGGRARPDFVEQLLQSLHVSQRW